MKTVLTPLLLLSCLSTSGFAAPEKLWSLAGFSEPESVVVDAEEGRLYVSNIEGSPLAVDGKGSISLVSMDGKMIERRWITGLDAPKGMAIRGDELWVADMSKLRVINLKTGEQTRVFEVAEAKMLNDVAVDEQGRVYVSDFLGGVVYRVNDGQLEPWLAADQIPHPNGLRVHKGMLLIGGWGHGMHDDFTTDSAGNLYEVEIETKAIRVVEGGASLGNLDGVGMLGDRVVVNDWINGKVFSVSEGSATELLNAGKTAADITVAGDALYVPVMFEHRLDVYALKD